MPLSELTDAYQPKVFTDENGIKTIVEFRENEDGKKVKVRCGLHDDSGLKKAWASAKREMNP